MKMHPIQWLDVKFTGDYVKTTPVELSCGEALRNYFQDTAIWESWPVRYDSTSSQTYRSANVLITGTAYQFRFQQNEQASTDITTNSVRALYYSTNDTYAENPTAVLNGGDIDQPPRTEDIDSMFMDRVFTLKAAITEGVADDSQFVPGFKILKGFKKHSRKFVYEEKASGVTHEEGGDIRYEFQSDDNATIGEVELFGYVRIYFRLLA